MKNDINLKKSSLISLEEIPIVNENEINFLSKILII